jgi:NAD(P)-dependent dehydrogenase (short-subunit alcohol dehydrogenase family)
VVQAAWRGEEDWQGQGGRASSVWPARRLRTGARLGALNLGGGAHLSVIAITGAGSGIGAATAARLQAAGHRVLGVDIRNAEILADLASADGRALAIAAVLEASHGVLDGLVLCAGVGPQVEPHAKIAAINYFGAVQLLDALRPALERGTAPSAVVVSSVASVQLPWSKNPIGAALEAGDEAQVATILAGAVQRPSNVRLALVDEGLHAFLLVTGGEQQLVGLALERQRGLERGVEAGQHHLLDLLRRQRRHRGDGRAIFSACGITSASGTTSQTRPIACASRADTGRPVSSIFMALNLPTARTSRCVPPMPGMMPMRISGWAKLAPSPATMMSQCIASSAPPPKA